MLQSRNESSRFALFNAVFFAKPCGLWFNTSSFLNKDVGPGPEIARFGALCLTLEKSEMKKTLVALAALSVVGLASAQSSVTMYGIIDLGIEKKTDTSAQITSNKESNTRIGFKGVEDLGGGLQASFVIETGILADTGGFSSNSGLATVGNRALWLSLGSKVAGTVSMGRGYVGGSATEQLADPTGTSYGDGSGAQSLFANVNTTRYSNTLRYQTPNWSGFSADIGLGLKGDAGQKTEALDGAIGGVALDGEATRNLASATKIGYTAAVNYKGGPIQVNAGITRAPGRPAGGAVDNENSVYSIAAVYDLGMVALSGVYELDDRYNDNEGAWLVGLSAPLGAGKLMAFYGENDNGGKTLSDKSSRYAVAYTHNLSKRTNVYAAVTRATFDGVGAAADHTISEVGLRHKF